MTLALELRVDPLLDGGEPQLLEPADLGRRERLEREVGQRVAPPESERVAQCGCATRRIEPARLTDEPREAAEVDRICLDLEHVPGVPSTDELRTEELPERRDGVLQGRGRGTRRLLAPDRADEELRRDDLPGPEGPTPGARGSRTARTARGFCPPSGSGSPSSATTSSGPSSRNSATRRL